MTLMCIGNPVLSAGHVPGIVPGLADSAGRDILPPMPDTDYDITCMLADGIRKIGKPTLRQLATEHAPDMPRSIAAAKILDHIRLCGFDIVRVKPPTPPHATS
jgi:hypothetical protein